MPPLLLKLLFTLMPKRAPALLRPLVRKVSNQALTSLWSIRNSSSTWRIGKANSAKANGSPAMNSQAADIQMSFPLEAAAARGRARAGSPEGDGVSRTHSCPAGL